MPDFERTEQEYKIGSSRVVIRLGDIATAETDVIMTSEDSHLSMGEGGTADAVRKAAGEGFRERVQLLADTADVGRVVVSDSGELAKRGVRYVFHGITIPSHWDTNVPDQGVVIRSCTERAVDLLKAQGLTSLAMPALGTGHAGFDVEASAVAMGEVLKERLAGIDEPLRIEMWLRPQGVDSDWTALEFFRHITEALRLEDAAVRDHHLLLIHGIRTQGEWRGRIRKELKAGDPRLNPLPIKYGFFDVVRFVLPVPWFRNQAVAAVRDRIAALDDSEREKLSVVAHSFGTFVVGELLKKHDLRLHRLILCGGILPLGFPWTAVKDQIEKIGDPDNPTYRVINDCGWKDIWPVLAEWVTLGYGATGRFGFGHPLVCDRDHPKDHGGFFDDGFASKWWLPVLAEKRIEDAELPPKAPWLLSVLSVLKLKFLVPAAALFALGWYLVR